VLLVVGRTRTAAMDVAAGWLIVIVADVALVTVAPGRLVVAMLALGNTIGLTVAGLALVFAARRAPGPAVLAGAGRVALSGLCAAAVGGAAGGGAGAALIAAVPSAGPVADALIAVLAVSCAAVAFAVVSYLPADSELRVVVLRARRAALRWRTALR
jgi:putative peptidoglycan lipid II flippase